MPPLWCISAARIVHDQRAATISYQDAQFELFGVPVLIPALLPAPRPLGQAPVRLFGAELSANSSTLGFGSRCPTTSPSPPTTISPSIPSIGPSRACSGRAISGTGSPNGQYNVKIAAIDQGRDQSAPPSTANKVGADRCETKGQFSLSSWWRFGWDVTVESDETFRRFYKLDPILQTDRVNTIYLQGMSERNYFERQALSFRRPAARPIPRTPIRCVHPGHRLQLHRRPAGARRRVELYRPCPLHDAQRRWHGQQRMPSPRRTGAAR